VRGSRIKQRKHLLPRFITPLASQDRNLWDAIVIKTLFVLLLVAGGVWAGYHRGFKAGQEAGISEVKNALEDIETLSFDEGQIYAYAQHDASGDTCFFHDQAKQLEKETKYFDATALKDKSGIVDALCRGQEQ
jgi:hypothetical protein